MFFCPTTTHSDQAIVIECKVSQNTPGLPSLAKAGLLQTTTKGYGIRAKAHAHVKKLLQIYCAFSGKQVVMKHKEVMG